MTKGDLLSEPVEVALYEHFFARAHFIPITAALVPQPIRRHVPLAYRRSTLYM